MPSRDRTVLALLGTADTDELCRKMDAAHELADPPSHGKENALPQEEGGGVGGLSGAKDIKKGGSSSVWDKCTPCVRALAVLPTARGGGEGGYSIVLGLETNSIYLLVTGIYVYICIYICIYVYIYIHIYIIIYICVYM